MQQSDLIAWLQETFRRMALKSPHFFQVYQTIGAIAVGVGFIPDALQWLDFTPNEIISKYIALAIKVAGAVMWFMAKMPVTDPKKPVDGKTGEQQAIGEVMPFTQKKKAEDTPLTIVPPNDAA
jgi:hypothetical protein